jgi:hypothetical protein
MCLSKKPLADLGRETRYRETPEAISMACATQANSDHLNMGSSNIRISLLAPDMLRQEIVQTHKWMDKPVYIARPRLEGIFRRASGTIIVM